MIDLTGRTDIAVPEEVLAELVTACSSLDLDLLVVGAAARDLVIHALQESDPVRATKDVDIAVAVRDYEQFTALAHRLDRTRRKGRPLHKFTVLGVEVDVVPFGGIERDRGVLFADDHLLDVTGIQEAYATSVTVRMPQGTEIRAAAAPAQTALKILAWRDRHQANPKDGLDLGVILEALSEDPFDDEVWEDDEALDATGADIVAAASYHYARIAAEAFTPADGQAVLNSDSFW
ncbi:putative nucleotidyltransferase [Brevibacterium sanguinis]|uniref:Nucleotidyltransferase n=2 Tax=Brevibacterium TaxID=1696 RepID=A0ABX9GMR6_9MICO|nr:MULTISPECIES: hypothetical protein [Brevibacterium]RBP62778.1 putative nucleotidyltransferase [Brevibacterium sanguinis]RBP69343.1 putative nucleotidyltransferase [Brevibacterium celere]